MHTVATTKVLNIYTMREISLEKGESVCNVIRYLGSNWLELRAWEADLSSRALTARDKAAGPHQ